MRPFPEEIRPLRISGTASIRLHQPEEGKADPLAGLSSPPPYHLLPADRARSAPLLRKRIRGASFTDFYLFSLLSHTHLHDLSLSLSLPFILPPVRDQHYGDGGARRTELCPASHGITVEYHRDAVLNCILVLQKISKKYRVNFVDIPFFKSSAHVRPCSKNGKSPSLRSHTILFSYDRQFF